MDENSDVFYIKAPASSVYLKTHVNKNLSKQTIWSMAHTRFATHGVNNKDNAHPHFGYDEKGIAQVTMVHNGVVHNHDDVWLALKRKPIGPVDSQAIAAALAVGGIEKVVETCEGSMSLIWSDARDPKGTLKFWSNGGNPLCAGRLDHPNTGAIVIASTVDILTKSQGKRLKTNWSCTVGREYTVHPDGSLTHRDIKGSADTAYGAYSWRSYASLVSKSGKKRKITVKKPKGKASGNSDNCTFTHLDDYNWDDIVLNDAINDVYASMSIHGFNPIDDYHGYDAMTHEGVRPDGSSYRLPNYFQGKEVDPVCDINQMVMVMRGEFDPRTTTKGFTEAESWMSDLSYGDAEFRDYYA